MAEPPVLAGAVQERLIAVVPLAVAARPVGAPGTLVAAAETAAVATLVSVSALLASSVKLTFTLIVVPRSAATSV